VTQVVRLTDGQVSAKYKYDPFGNSIGQFDSINNPFRFSTKAFDYLTQLYYYGYRYYSPRLGRWVTRDPIGEDGGENLYAFLGNNTFNNIDPIGLLKGTGGDCPNTDLYNNISLLTKACKDGAEKISDKDLRDCVITECENGIVICNGECCKRGGYYFGFNRKPNFGTDHVIYICTVPIDNFLQPGTGMNVGDVMAHEFAHECGWNHQQRRKGVPDMPRDGWGELDWKKLCEKYPNYKPCLERNKTWLYPSAS
jgi:RHS repeat-associated protein